MFYFQFNYPPNIIVIQVKKRYQSRKIQNSPILYAFLNNYKILLSISNIL